MLSQCTTHSKGPQVGIKTGPLLRTQPPYLDCTLRWATRVPWFWSFDVICWQREENRIRISPDTSHLNHPYTHTRLHKTQFQPNIIIIIIIVIGSLSVWSYWPSVEWYVAVTAVTWLELCIFRDFVPHKVPFEVCREGNEGSGRFFIGPVVF